MGWIRAIREHRSQWSQFREHPGTFRYFLRWLKYLARNGSALEEDIPWMPFSVIDWLQKYLNKEMKVLEWGSGGSTIFLLKRTAELVSVEHHLEWYNAVSKRLRNCDSSHLEYLLIEPRRRDASKAPESLPHYISRDPRYGEFCFDDYCRAVLQYADNYFDLILIDGRARTSCMYHALNKVKPGGYLVLDDSDRESYGEGKEMVVKWKEYYHFGPGPFLDFFWGTSLWQKPT
ncbi:hypothetical protein JW877_02730 [bacterium]|nr:hypothetical protein [bacterium]